MLKSRITIICTAVVASLITTGLTLLAMKYFEKTGTDSPGRTMEVERFVLRAENGTIAAELKSKGGRTELILYSAAQKQALAIGVDQIRQLKYIDFLDDSGSPQGGWTQGGKFGEGTICIGDNQRPNSVCLGAEQRELGEIHRPAERWGLWVAPGSRHSGDGAFYSTLAPDKSQWIAGFHIWNKSKEFSIVPGFKQSPLDAGIR